MSNSTMLKIRDAFPFHVQAPPRWSHYHWGRSLTILKAVWNVCDAEGRYHGHANTPLCRRGQALIQQPTAVEDARRSQQQVFMVNGMQLETEHQFKHLGCYLIRMDDDWQTVHKNLAKARKKWAIVAHILLREQHSPCISGMFHKAIVQTAFLYESETWCLTEPMIQVFGRFSS